MKLRPFQMTDYTMVCEWWRGHNAAIIPKEILPDFGVVSHEENDLACGWLYRDVGGMIGLVSWMTTNPRFSKKTGRAVDMILDFFEEQCPVVMDYIEPHTGLYRLHKRRKWQNVNSRGHVLLTKVKGVKNGS